MKNLCLTARERAAARCMLKGWGDAKSSRQLGIAKTTVREYNKKLYDKTGQDGQIGLVTFLLYNPWAMEQVMDIKYDVQ